MVSFNVGFDATVINWEQLKGCATSALYAYLEFLGISLLCKTEHYRGKVGKGQRIVCMAI